MGPRSKQWWIGGSLTIRDSDKRVYSNMNGGPNIVQYCNSISFFVFCSLLTGSTPDFRWLRYLTIGIRWAFTPTTSGWWFGTFYMNFHILGIVSPTDYWFSEGFKPPTRHLWWQFPNLLIPTRESWSIIESWWKLDMHQVSQPKSQRGGNYLDV